MNSHQDVRVAISLPHVTKHRSVAIVQLPLNVIAPLTRVRYSLAIFFFSAKRQPQKLCQPLQLLAHAPHPIANIFLLNDRSSMNAALNIFLFANDHTMRIRSSSDLTDLNDSAPMNCLVGESIDVLYKFFYKTL
jgi:hypothetical protein